MDMDQAKKLMKLQQEAMKVKKELENTIIESEVEGLVMSVNGEMKVEKVEFETNDLIPWLSPSQKETLEKAFKADIKKRIDETSKYIRPEEGTMDFAFMFIPSEGVYYDMLINRVGTLSVNTVNLIEYAFKEKHVIIVSPTSFYAYLQTVLQGLKSLQIEEAAKDIQKQVHILWKHLRSYEESLSRLGNSLWVSVNH